MWLESTSENSFAESETDDTSTLSAWNYINPTSSTKYNATQATTANKPRYVENCVSGLPCVNFDGLAESTAGNRDYLSFDGTFLSGSDYTIFVVDQRRSNSASAFIGGSGANGANLLLGYGTEQIIFEHYNDGRYFTAPSYSTPVPAVNSFVFSVTSANHKDYYRNGVAGTEVGSPTDTGAALTSFLGAAVGGCSGCTGDVSTYTGDLAEIIVFNRALKTEERRAIEAYLGKKWGVVVL
jgi:hypothetical protein